MLAVDTAFVDFTLGFASNYMADRVMCALVSRAVAAVRRFIAAAAPAAHMAALRGHRFEGVALAALAAGARVRVRRLLPAGDARAPRDAADEEAEEVLPARRVFEYMSAQQFADDAPPGALGCPVSGSQPTWDALALDTAGLTLFQVTVSKPERHGISAAGLVGLEPLLHARYARLRFAFLVPPERFVAATRAVRIKHAPEWATTRLKQVVMTLSEEAFDAAARSACAEAEDAVRAVDAAAAAQPTAEQTVAPRKRRAAALLPAGGGSP